MADDVLYEQTNAFYMGHYQVRCRNDGIVRDHDLRTQSPKVGVYLDACCRIISNCKHGCCAFREQYIAIEYYDMIMHGDDYFV